MLYVPEDILEVRSPNSDIIGNSYVLPPRQNRGKPPDRFSPDAKVKYAIAQYVSTHRLSPKYQALVNQMVGIKIPTKVEEALQDSRWTEAMEVEMEALQRNGTWNVVPLPRGKRPVGCKWVFTIKHKADEIHR